MNSPYVIANWKLIIIWWIHYRDRLIIIVSSVLISYGVNRMESWTPKTQPNDSSVVIWLIFWCSTRFSRTKVTCQKSKTVKGIMSYVDGPLTYDAHVWAASLMIRVIRQKLIKKDFEFAWANGYHVWPATLLTKISRYKLIIYIYLKCDFKINS